MPHSAEADRLQSAKDAGGRQDRLKDGYGIVVDWGKAPSSPHLMGRQYGLVGDRVQTVQAIAAWDASSEAAIENLT